MYIHKSQALPSKYLQFKPAKQTMLFTVTATYLPPETGQSVFWRSLPYRFPAHTAEHPSGQSLAAAARAARKRGETRKSSRSRYLPHCPASCTQLGKVQAVLKSKREGRDLSAAMGETEGVQVSEHVLKRRWHNHFR